MSSKLQFLPSSILAGYLLLLALLQAGCASPARRAPATDPAPLAARLNELASFTAPKESRMIAAMAHQRSRELAVAYGSVRPAWTQNALVHAGLRPRGLCYQWAEDLGHTLAQLPQDRFDLHWAVARQGTPREHHALVVTVRDQPFSRGIVLDAWRRSGRLYWGEVTNDKYPWVTLPHGPWGQEGKEAWRAGR